MAIDALSAVGVSQLQKSNIAQEASNSNGNFEDILKNAIDKVNDKQIEADNSTQELMTGEATDIHQVMLTTEEAKISLELAVQIRNKLVDAYQEIMRMQI